MPNIANGSNSIWILAMRHVRHPLLRSQCTGCDTSRQLVHHRHVIWIIRNHFTMRRIRLNVLPATGALLVAPLAMHRVTTVRSFDPYSQILMYIFNYDVLLWGNFQEKRFLIPNLALCITYFHIFHQFNYLSKFLVIPGWKISWFFFIYISCTCNIIYTY